MRYTVNSPTSAIAIGNVEQGIRQMRREAERLGRLRREGRLSFKQEERARQRFRSIFRPLLEDALQD